MRPRACQIHACRNGAFQRLADITPDGLHQFGGMRAGNGSSLKRFEGRSLRFGRRTRIEQSMRQQRTGNPDGISIQPKHFLAQVFAQESKQARCEHRGPA